MISPPKRVVTTDLAEEHARVIDVVQRVEDAAVPDHVRAALRELATTLAAHFHEEEDQDGVFDWIVALDHRQLAQVEALIVDHERILLELSAALEAPDDQVRRGARVVAAHVRRHEKIEMQTLRAARR